MRCEKEIFEFIDSQRENMVKTLKDFIRIPGIKSEAKEGMPYGEAIDRTLKLARKKADELGLNTDCFDNKIVISGLNEKQPKLGILCHMDVVGVDENSWTSQPFDPVIKGNMIYGRGSLDNKGPAVAALYAAYAVKELSIPLKYNVRLFFGGDEESGSNDLNDYLKKHSLPEYNFVPDADFPVGVTEKGRIVLEGNVKALSDKVVAIHSGSAVNIIPEKAEAVLKNVSLEEIVEIIATIPDIKYSTVKEKDTIKITVFGKSTHSANPQNGINALTAMIYFLSKIDTENKILQELTRCFRHGVFFGGGCGIPEGRLTLSLTMMNYENGRMTFQTDSRVTHTECSKELAQIIINSIDIPITIIRLEQPHIVSRDATIVKTLQNIYYQHTGRGDKPYDMDAFTYAHRVENAVIFGGVLYGDGSCNAHGNDECYNLDTMIDSAKMFAKAIIELCG